MTTLTVPATPEEDASLRPVPWRRMAWVTWRQHRLALAGVAVFLSAASAWVVSQWWTKDGTFAFAGWPSDSLLTRYCSGPPAGTVGTFGKPKSLSLVQCLSQHGYTQWTSYHPASQFWPFQWIEGGWLLALSALLIAVTVWLVRRRAT